MGIKHYLAFIVEIDLNYFVIQSEKNGLVSFDPFFDVYKRNILRLDWSSIAVSSLKVFPEILHQGHFF